MSADYPSSQEYDEAEIELERFIESQSLQISMGILTIDELEARENVNSTMLISNWIASSGGVSVDISEEGVVYKTSIDEVEIIKEDRDEWIKTKLDKDFTFEDPYKLDDLSRMLICRTAEMDLNGKVSIIEANPNDPSHILKNMDHPDSKMKPFPNANIRRTSDISTIFWAKAMEKTYDKNGLRSHIVSSPSSANVELISKDRDGPIPELDSFAWAKTHPEFHERFHQNYTLQMNHRLTQEAIELNRTYNAQGEMIHDHMKHPFQYKYFIKTAEKVANDAFERTIHQLQQEKHLSKVNEKLETYKQKFEKRYEKQIQNEGFIQGFGKEFKAKPNLTRKQQVDTIRKDYKIFANKKLDELKDKNIEVIMAKGIAELRGDKKVSKNHLDEAKSFFENARKDPVKYSSPEHIVKQVSGTDKDFTKKLLHCLDGRSTFQRSYKTVEKFGSHLNANADDRTRIKAIDREKGREFSATAMMGIPPGNIKNTLKHAIEVKGYSVENCIDARKRMMKYEGKIKDDSGKVRTINHAAEKAEIKMQIEKQQAEIKAQKDAEMEKAKAARDEERRKEREDEENKKKNDGPKLGR